MNAPDSALAPTTPRSNPPRPPPPRPATRSAAHSRFVQRVRRRYGDELSRLPPGLPDFATTITALIANSRPTARP